MVYVWAAVLYKKIVVHEMVTTFFSPPPFQPLVRFLSILVFYRLRLDSALISRLRLHTESWLGACYAIYPFLERIN